jgi:transcription initiation factor TFIIIB Brf1 subunit/transcription initiation factor TFIIB
MNEVCKICGSKTRQFLDKQFSEYYYYCETCEFISKDEERTLEVDLEKDVYDTHENSIENEGYVNMFKKFLDDAAMKFVGEGKSGFDFGSGPEPVLAQILTRDYGYDMDIYDLFYSPKKTYEGKKYDLITSTEVVEHLKNPMIYFNLFKNLLKEDGVLAIMTLFHPKDDEKFGDWWYRRDKTHISFFTRKTMETIAEMLELKVLYTDDKRCCSFKLK